MKRLSSQVRTQTEVKMSILCGLATDSARKKDSTIKKNLDKSTRTTQVDAS